MTAAGAAVGGRALPAQCAAADPAGEAAPRGGLRGAEGAPAGEGNAAGDHGAAAGSRAVAAERAAAGPAAGTACAPEGCCTREQGARDGEVLDPEPEAGRPAEADADVVLLLSDSEVGSELVRHSLMTLNGLYKSLISLPVCHGLHLFVVAWSCPWRLWP